MALDSYFEPFIMQSWISQPDGFGGLKWGWTDGAEFQGIYAQDTSTEMRIAEAQGVSSSGTFVTGINVQVDEGDVVRRVRDNMYFKITGLPVDSPEQAASQFRRMNAERTVKPV